MTDTLTQTESLFHGRSPAETLALMTTEEKIALTAGHGMWRSRAIPRLGIPAILMTDGTYGVRYSIDQIDREAGKVDIRSFLGLVNQKKRGMSEAFGRTRPATCFPNGSAIGCSWDVQLAYRVGAALAAECRNFGVHLLLGPGINTRRTPLAGRAYEYYSEDPVINGDIAAGVINGLQDNGVGATLKHFACNNSEVERTTMDSIVDERALREIYLRGFERAIAKSAPWAVMSSYNRLNGEQASQSRHLLTGVLREDWGWDGLVVSDWHGIKDPVAALAAGSDLDMPQAEVRIDEVRAAAAAGTLDLAALDRAAGNMLRLIAKAKAGEGPVALDLASHHALAVEAAAESVVLLKNDGTLPLAETARLAVIGRAAEAPMIQGSGSATTNPFQVDRPLDCIRALAPDTTYAPGYAEDGSVTDALLDQALMHAEAAETVLVFVHAQSGEDGEGADRRSLALAPGQDALIAALTATGRPVIVMVMSPDAVVMPWIADVAGVFALFFAGQGLGAAIAALLFGRANPCGKLSATFPARVEDIPGWMSYPGEAGRHPYVEGPHVGYRGYDRRGTAPLFPFGHGLSYTSFTYDGLSFDRYMLGRGETLTVRFTVTNTGNRPGKEIVQLYLAPESCALSRAPRELKAFTKLALEPGESREVSLSLETGDFAYWHPDFGDWTVDDGQYRVEIGASSRDIRLGKALRVATAIARHGFVTLETQPKHILDYPRARAEFGSFLCERLGITDEEADRMLSFCVTSFFGIHTTLNYFFKQSFTREDVQKVLDRINGAA